MPHGARVATSVRSTERFVQRPAAIIRIAIHIRVLIIRDFAGSFRPAAVGWNYEQTYANSRRHRHGCHSRRHHRHDLTRYRRTYKTIPYVDASAISWCRVRVSYIRTTQ